MNSTTSASPPIRLASIDAYRGLVMALMIGEALSFANVSAGIPDSLFWRFLAFHQEHVEWIGCSLHDLIQPSFSFLVGVAFPPLVVGANSIAAYCIAHLWDGFLTRFLRANFGPGLFRMLGDAYEPLLLGASVMLVLWLVLLWMYRRKLFLKI